MGFFSFTAKQAGRYFVKVRDAEFGGTNESNYRLHVGSFSRPSVAFPSGGKIGEKTKLTLIGDQWGDFKKTEDRGHCGRVARQRITWLARCGSRSDTVAV